MVDVKNKLCPFRVFREKTHFKYSEADATTEKFYDCLGEKCAAYYQGGCQRLVPPALVIGDSPLRWREDLTDAEIEKMLEELKKAPLMAMPSTEPSVEFVQNWIPVTERLPTEADGSVLVCLADKPPYNYMEHYINAKHDQRVEIGHYSEHSHKWYGTIGNDVIGWMPLPEPLKEA